MKKIHYAWVICAAAVLTMICASSFCGTLLSAYLPYIVAAGITGSQSSAILSLRSAATLVAMFFVSRYYERLLLRLGISLALVLAGGAMLLFSLGARLLSITRRPLRLFASRCCGSSTVAAEV